MSKSDKSIKGLVLMMWLVLGVSRLQAQKDDLRAVSTQYAIRNATIVQAPGKVIKNGTILMEDGVIKKVGPSVVIPPEAWVIEADSMFVYPGFISGFSTIGVGKAEDEKAKLDDKLTGNPPYEYAGIMPNASVRGRLDPDEKSIKDFRALGFTAAQTSLEEGMLPGTSSIVLLGGNSPDQMLINENTSMVSLFKGASGVYPNTLIGVMASYRDLYRKASQAKAYEARYLANPSGMERPVKNEVLEALYPVVGKKMPVVFHTEGIKDILRAKTLQKELGFALQFAEVKQGWDALTTFKSLQAPVYLSLDLPKWEEAPEETSEETSEKEAPTPEALEEKALEERKFASIKNYYTLGGLLSQHKVRFGFSTKEVKPKDFKPNLLRVIENGLSEEQALAALTTQPAAFLGLSASMGTLEVGKMANLIVTDTAYFSENANIRYVFVDGVKYEYEAKTKKKKATGKGENIDPLGTWDYTYSSEGGEWSGTFTITGETDSYEGSIYLSSVDKEFDLSEITVSGDLLTFESDVTAYGESATLSFRLTVTNDTAEGNMDAEHFGSYEMDATKKPK